MLRLKKIENTPISSNCFILYDKAVGSDCIIIDPGSNDNTQLFSYLKKNELIPVYIILTHEHFDHCWGVNEIRLLYPDVKLICSSICSEAIQDKRKNYSVFHQQPGFELKAADIILEDIDWKLAWAGNEIRFIPALGHSSAGIVFFISKYVFTGDSLIYGVRTVTKLKTASKEGLMETISILEKEKGKGLMVCPGHGILFSLDNYDLFKAIIS